MIRATMIPMRTRGGDSVLIKILYVDTRLEILGLAPLDRVSIAGRNGTIIGFGRQTCCSLHEKEAEKLWVQMDDETGVAHYPGLPDSLCYLRPLQNDDLGIPSAIIDTFTLYSMSLIKHRATEICIALQSMKLPALVTQTLLDAACPFAVLVPFHKKWNLVTAIKHFHS